MKLRIVGDAIVEADATVIAVFVSQLLPSVRDRAEELLMRAAVEGDWELQERIWTQQDKVAELEQDIDRLNDVIADLQFQIREIAKV